MGNKLILGAYWKARRESLEQCTDRLLKFMCGIREYDEAFTHWYRLGRSRQDALRRKVDTQNRQELLTFLGKGRNRRDEGGTVIENLGFSIWMWNGGKSGREACFNVACGLYSEVPGLCNCVVLDFPEDLGGPADPVRTKGILLLAATCWDPDWAGVFSDEARQSRDWQRQPFVDWMVYVSRRIKHIQDVPLPSLATQVNDIGSLIVVQPNPPSTSNSDDSEHIRRIEEIVQSQGERTE